VGGKAAARPRATSLVLLIGFEAFAGQRVRLLIIILVASWGIWPENQPRSPRMVNDQSA
jgi:hypothetical protein